MRHFSAPRREASPDEARATWDNLFKIYAALGAQEICDRLLASWRAGNWQAVETITEELLADLEFARGYLCPPASGEQAMK